VVGAASNLLLGSVPWSGVGCCEGVGFCVEITCVLSQKEASDLVTGGVFDSLELAQVRVVLIGMGANQYPIW
jgi:hypothetical protein